MRIAIDAHGGDHAPESILEGLTMAAQTWPDTTFLLLGLDPKLRPEGYPNIQFHQVSEVITADDEPVKAIRRKRNSSIVVGCQMVKEKNADVFISAGNTGALMAAGLIYTGRLQAVDRPALAPVFPTITGKSFVVLDVGANPEAKAEHLRQYAVMGSIYAKKVLGYEQPKVGLLNIGSETGKGTSLTKETFALLEQEEGLNFIGNVEAREILYRPCDVLVCDGFSGNILLKNAEGVAKAIFEKLKEVFVKNWRTRLAAALLMKDLKGLRKEMDYQEHGGAPLLGLAGPIIKAHGSSSGTAIFHAIRQAHLFVERQVIAHMEQELSNKERMNS